MPARHSILLIVLSALIALPTGIARAGDIDVQNGNTRVTISEDSDDITIYKTVPTRPIYPYSLPNSKVRVQPNIIQGRTYKVPTTTQILPCKRSITRQSTQSSSSSTGINRTYSSTTTTMCR